MDSLNGYHILIVDDDEDLRDVVAEDFVIQGAQVKTASCGNEALELIKLHKFDFILSDIRMPNGDGKFLAEEIKRMSSNDKPAVFIYSGYNDLSQEDAESLEVVQVFNKPYSINQVIESILSHFKNLLK